MTLSTKMKFAAVALLTPTLLGACATMEGIKTDATSLQNKYFAPDTTAQIADKTGATLAAVKAFDVKCQEVGQKVTAERTSPIYQLENKTYKLGCE